MKIALFELIARSKPDPGEIDLPTFFALRKKIEEESKLEMRGLGLPGHIHLAPSTSDRCTLHFLKNGAQLFKYGSRYAIVASDDEIMLKAIKLFGLNPSHPMTITDPDQPRKRI